VAGWLAGGEGGALSSKNKLIFAPPELEPARSISRRWLVAPPPPAPAERERPSSTRHRYCIITSQNEREREKIHESCGEQGLGGSKQAVGGFLAQTRAQETGHHIHTLGLGQTAALAVGWPAGRSLV